VITAPVLAVWIAAGLGAAVVVGWVLRGVWSWACRATAPERQRIDALVDELHAAEEAREAAEAARAEAEDRLAETEALLTAELDDLRGRVEAALAEAEAERARAVAAAEAEARTAWEGLAAARRRIAELEAARSETRDRG